MSASSLVNEELQPGPTPSPPRPVVGLAGAGAGARGRRARLLMVKAATDAAGLQPRRPVSDHRRRRPGGAQPVRRGCRASARSRRRASVAALLAEDELVAARRVAARGREEALISHGVRRGRPHRRGAADLRLRQQRRRRDAPSSPSTRSSSRSTRSSTRFWTNIWVACVAEVLVLILGLLVAIVRMLPGRAGAPLRLIAVVYCDVFRAIPAIVVIFLIVFGLPADRRARSSSTMPDDLARHHRADADLHGVRLGGLPRRPRLDPPEPERGRPVPGPQLRRRPCARCWCRRRCAG